MNYKIVEPTEMLRPYVKYFWALSSDDVGDKQFRTFADPSPGLIIQPREDGQMIQNKKALPSTFLFGQTTGPAEIGLLGRFRTIGACLHPEALQLIFRVKPPELTDTCVDISLLSNAGTLRSNERLLTGSVASRIQFLEEGLLSMVITQNKLADVAMNFAYNHIVNSGGKCSMRSLQQVLGISERSFERRFKSYAGISPKLFSRIQRFQQSLIDIRTASEPQFTKIAYDNAYADQAHFIRNLKEFSGISPGTLKSRSFSIVDNLNEIVL